MTLACCYVIFISKITLLLYMVTYFIKLLHAKLQLKEKLTSTNLCLDSINFTLLHEWVSKMT